MRGHTCAIRCTDRGARPLRPLATPSLWDGRQVFGFGAATAPRAGRRGRPVTPRQNSTDWRYCAVRTYSAGSSAKCALVYFFSRDGRSCARLRGVVTDRAALTALVDDARVDGAVPRGDHEMEIWSKLRWKVV